MVHRNLLKKFWILFPNFFLPFPFFTFSSVSLCNPVDVDGIGWSANVLLAISENWRKLKLNGDVDADVELHPRCQNKLLDDDELLDDGDEGNVKVIT